MHEQDKVRNPNTLKTEIEPYNYCLSDPWREEETDDGAWWPWAEISLRGWGSRRRGEEDERRRARL